MSDIWQLIAAISKTAEVPDRVDLLEQISEALPDVTLPYGTTSASLQAAENGETVIASVGNTAWMRQGMSLQIGKQVDGSFRGMFARVDEKLSSTSVRLEVLGLSNMLPTETISSGAEITLGAVNGVRTATVECSNPFGWTKLRSGGSWTPATATSTLTARFYLADEEVASRSIVATLNTGTGEISTTATGIENNIALTILSTGSLFAVRFTYLPSLAGPAINTVEKTLVAQNFSLSDGAQGVAGTPGFSAVYGVWDTLFSTPSNLGYQVIVKRGNSWYVTKDTVTSLGPLEGPPSDDSSGNTWWTKLPFFYNVATSLMSNALFSVGEGSQLLKMSKSISTGVAKLEVSGVITPQRGSLISNKFVDAELRTPQVFPAAGTYDALNIIIPAPSLSAKVYYTDDGSTPDNTDTRWNPNLLLYSEKLDESVWVKVSGTIVSDSEEAPNPAITAYKGVGGASNFEAYQEILNSDAGGFITKGQYISASLYVKATDPSITSLRIGIQEYDGTTKITEVLKTFTVSSTEWTRVAITHQITQASSITDRIRFHLYSTESTSGGGQGFFLSMAQVEYGEWPSAYLATTSARAGSLNIAATATIKAIAEKFGESSYVRTKAYTITSSPGPSDPVSKPYEAPPQGGYIDYDWPLYVELFASTSGANIYYTTDGSTPSAASTLYTGPIMIEEYTVIKAIAILAGRADSQVLTAVYYQIDDYYDY